MTYKTRRLRGCGLTDDQFVELLRLARLVDLDEQGEDFITTLEANYRRYGEAVYFAPSVENRLLALAEAGRATEEATI